MKCELLIHSEETASARGTKPSRAKVGRPTPEIRSTEMVKSVNRLPQVGRPTSQGRLTDIEGSVDGTQGVGGPTQEGVTNGNEA